MYTQKSFNMVTTFDGNEYKTKVSQFNYDDPQREGENPTRKFTEKEYLNTDVNKIQESIEEDFGVCLVYGDLFDWFWYPVSLIKE